MFLGLLVLGSTVLVSSSYNFRYVQGPLNTASCADPNTVLTLDECQDAGRFLGFGEVKKPKKEYHDAMPSGCVSKGDNIFYNTIDEGNANENCSPICLEKPVKYVHGLADTVCPEFSSIESQAECSQAADDLSFYPQVQVMETPDYPRCYYGESSIVYFNTKGTSSNKHATPICLRIPGPDPCEGVSCPDSEICVNGICADPCSRCGETEQCLSGKCVELPCKGSCADWEHCEDDKCIDTKCQELNVKCKDNGYEYCLEGTCIDRCDQDCEDIEWGPEDLSVCGSNGVTYENECLFYEAQCRDKTLTEKNEGPCPVHCSPESGLLLCPGSDGQCIHEDAMCDGSVDCGDGWDESDCDPCSRCGENEQCIDGECVEESTEKSYVECLATLLNGLYLQISNYLDSLLPEEM